MSTIYVSETFFASLENKINLVEITGGKIIHLIPIENKMYCLSGAMGTGTGTGWETMWAYEAVPLAHYRNKIQPLPYNAHFNEVNKGMRERGYDGLLLEHRKIKHVLTGDEKTILPITFRFLPVWLLNKNFYG